MRRKFFLALFVLSLIFLIPAFAVNVDIYPSYVIVKDKWPVNIGAGQTESMEWNLPDNVDVGSFSILDPTIDILSRTEAIEKGSLVGKNVTVFTVNNAYRGVVKEDGYKLVLINPRNDQLVAIINSDKIVSVVPDDTTFTKNNLKLEVKNAGVENVRELPVRYFASGITWQVKYILQVDRNKAILNGEYQIENNTNTEIKDAIVRLIARNDSQNLFKTREVLMYAGNSTEDALGAPSVEHQAETAVYSIPGKVTVPANSILRLMLLKEDDLELERIYRMNNNNVTVEYSLKGIEQALPAGQIQIFDGDILMGTQSLSSKPESGELILNLGQTMDIAGKREQVNYTNTDNIYSNEYVVTLKNNKDEKVTVEVMVSLPRDNAIVICEPGLEVKRVSSYNAVISVEVEANSERVFSYTTQYSR
ncbi:MAG: hypothetical protein PHI65_02440, partial [Firmicutes bacterium]|nr:hypothetical protein [Bacillota bacterium]